MQIVNELWNSHNPAVIVGEVLVYVAILYGVSWLLVKSRRRG